MINGSEFFFKCENGVVEEIVNDDKILIQGFLPEESELISETEVQYDIKNNNDCQTKFLDNIKFESNIHLANPNMANEDSTISNFEVCECGGKVSGETFERSVEIQLNNNRSLGMNSNNNFVGGSSGYAFVNSLNVYIPISNFDFSGNSYNCKKTRHDNSKVFKVNKKKVGIRDTTKLIYGYLKYMNRIQSVINFAFKNMKNGGSLIFGLEIPERMGKGILGKGSGKRVLDDNRVVKDKFQLSIKSRANLSQSSYNKRGNTGFSISFDTSFFGIRNELDKSEEMCSGERSNADTFVFFQNKQILAFMSNNLNNKNDGLSDKIIEMNEDEESERNMELEDENNSGVEPCIIDRSILKLEKNNIIVASKSELSNKTHLNSTDINGESKENNEMTCKKNIIYSNEFSGSDNKSIISLKHGNSDSEEADTSDANQLDKKIIENIVTEEFFVKCEKSDHFEENEGKQSGYTTLNKCEEVNDNIVTKQRMCSDISKSKSESAANGDEFCEINSKKDEDDILIERIKDCESSILENKYNLSNETKYDNCIDDKMNSINSMKIRNEFEIDDVFEDKFSSSEAGVDDGRFFKMDKDECEKNLPFKGVVKQGDNICEFKDTECIVNCGRSINSKESELCVKISRKQNFGVFDKLVCLTRNRNMVRASLSNFSRETMNAIDIIKNSTRTNCKYNAS